MKIRNRLTLQFMALSAIILVVVLCSVYYFTNKNRESNFYDLLRQRTIATANLYLERDEVSDKVFQIFQRQYEDTLHSEILQVFDSTDHAVFIPISNEVYYSTQIKNEIRQTKELRFKEGDRQMVGIYYPDNQGNFVIIASAVDAEGQKAMVHLAWLMTAGFVAALFLIFLAGRIFSRNALEPIQNIIRRVQRITASNLHLRVDEGKGKDEISRLAITFNDMLERLESSFIMQQNFVNNASHELRTPLTSIMGEIEVLLSRKRGEEDYRDALNSILLDVQQMNEMINSLLHMARTSAVDFNVPQEEVRLDELLYDIRSAKMHEHPDAVIDIFMDEWPEDSSKLVVHGNRQLLQIGLTNVMDNALKFSENKPVYCHLQFSDDKLMLKVIDSGIGISEGEVKKIFQPFYRTSEARNFPGHGIGLSLAEKIFRFSGAVISLHSRLGEGSVFNITFEKSNKMQTDFLMEF